MENKSKAQLNMETIADKYPRLTDTTKQTAFLGTMENKQTCENCELENIKALEMKEKLVKERILEALDNIDNDDEIFKKWGYDGVSAYRQAFEDVIKLIKQ